MQALDTQQVIAVIGCGTMGAGIAQVAANAGHNVLMYDKQTENIQRGIDGITQGLERQILRGKLTESERDTLLNRLTPCHTLNQLAPASLVIEAIIERLDIKQKLFAELENLLAEDAILATNTSSISITAIGSALTRPQNLVGMHFFNPAPVMKLVEVVSGLATEPSIAQCIFTTATAWGKKAVHTRSSPGFIVNRVARPFYAEALRALTEGATDIATLDAVFRESGGFRMGPFELMDLIGHDVNYAVTQSVWQAYYHDPRFTPSLIQKERVDAGFLGRKSGKGFYNYDPKSESISPQTAPQVLSSSLLRKQISKPIVLRGSGGLAQQLLALIRYYNLPVIHQEIPSTSLQPAPLHILLDQVTLTLTDGRLASQHMADHSLRLDSLSKDSVLNRNTVLFDLALDYQTCQRIALSPADQCCSQAIEQAIIFWQMLGKNISVIDDIPGMLVMRTVAMLANEGADAVNQRICATEAVDTAMSFGVNYPQGPLRWADSLGISRVVQVLDNLNHIYGEDRYRYSPLLQRKFITQSAFYTAPTNKNRSDIVNNQIHKPSSLEGSL